MGGSGWSWQPRANPCLHRKKQEEKLPQKADTAGASGWIRADRLTLADSCLTRQPGTKPVLLVLHKASLLFDLAFQSRACTATISPKSVYNRHPNPASVQKDAIHS